MAVANLERGTKVDPVRAVDLKKFSENDAIKLK